MSDWIKRSSNVLMDTYARWPVVPVRGEGMYLTTEDGTRYLDFLAGIAVTVLGHSHPRVTEAIRNQAGELMHCSNLFHIPSQVRLAETLLEHSDFSRAFFCNSGTEAVESGLKLARLWGKEKKGGAAKIVAMEHSFHGRTVGALSLTGQEKYRAPFEPLMTAVEYVPFKTHYRDNYEVWEHQSFQDCHQVSIHRLLAVSEYGFDTVANKEIHHKNGIKWDNRPNNIEPLTTREHRQVHAERGDYSN